jgi:hypothetical protein
LEVNFHTWQLTAQALRAGVRPLDDKGNSRVAREYANQWKVVSIVRVAISIQFR